MLKYFRKSAVQTRPVRLDAEFTFTAASSYDRKLVWSMAMNVAIAVMEVRLHLFMAWAVLFHVSIKVSLRTNESRLAIFTSQLLPNWSGS